MSLSPGPPPAWLLCPPEPPSLTSQQEDTNKDKWLLYKVSISDSSILYRVGLGPLLLPFLLPSTSRPHEIMGRVKSPPLCALLPTTTNLLFFLFETCGSVSLYQGVVEGEGNKDQGETLRNHVDSVLEMGRRCQRLFMMCRSHFPESSNQQIGKYEQSVKLEEWRGVKSVPKLAPVT